MSALSVHNNYEKVTDEHQDTQESETGVRHVQALLLFTCMTIIYINGAHISVTIVAMTQKGHTNRIIDSPSFRTLANFSDTKESLAEDIIENNEQNLRNQTDTYDWTKSIQEIILTGYLFGTTIALCPMAVIVQRWGPKLPLQSAWIVNCFICAVTPWAITWGDWQILTIIRVIQGFSPAICYLSCISMIPKWIPKHERSRVTSYIYTGTSLGIFLAYQISGLLSSSSWSWPAVWWVSSCLSFIAFCLTTLFIASSPATCRFITVEEKRFLHRNVDNVANVSHSIPWKKIMTSKHTWAIFVTNVGCGVTLTFILIQLPSYFHHVLGVSIKKSGVLLSLPYIMRILAGIVIGYLSDFVINKHIVSVKCARIICNSIGSVGVALCLSAVTFTSDITWAVVWSVSGMAMHSATYSGWMLNCIDLAPNYSSSIVAISNTITHIGMLVMPFIVTNILDDMTDQQQWRTLFLIVAGIGFLGNFIFIKFMSTDVQPWNNECYVETSPDEKERSITTVN